MKRAPITVDIGDEVDRPIRFSMAYCNAIKAKYGSIRDMLTQADADDALPQMIYDGLVDKGEMSVTSIAETLDASLQQELWLKILWALTGNKVEPTNPRTLVADPNSPTLTVQ